MAKKYGALLFIGLGAGLLFLGSSKPAHARALKPVPDEDEDEGDEETPVAPVVPLPPPQTPLQPDHVVVEKPGEEPQEVPVGDVLLGDIEVTTPGGTTTTPAAELPDDEEEDDDEAPPAPPSEVLPAEEEEDEGDEEHDDEDEDILQPQVVPPGAPIPSAEAPAPPVIAAPPVVTAPPPAAAPAPPAEPNNPEQKTTLASDTAELLRLMLKDEMGPNWKRYLDELKPWQSARGLKPDGAFGTVSALKMAEETGLLPIVRFWPKGSYPEGHWLTDYRRALKALSMTKPEPQASQLVAASNREKGQGFGRGQAPISPAIQI